MKQGKSIHVVAAIPSHGAHWPVPFATSLMRLVRNVGNYPIPGVRELRLTTNVVSGSMLAHNREQLLRTAEQKGAHYVLWLDSDMKFPADTLHHLLRWGQPFVAAQGVTKQIPASPVAQRLDGTPLVTREDERGLREVRQVGLAVALVSVRHANQMSKPRFDMPFVPEKDAPMGEDVFFCRKWAEETGEKIFVDVGLSWQIGHVGSYTYEMKDVTVDTVVRRVSPFKRVVG